MKYFSIETSKKGDVVSSAIFDRGDNLEEAKTVLYGVIASNRTAVEQGTNDSCMCMLINEQGGVEVKGEYYEKA